MKKKISLWHKKLILLLFYSSKLTLKKTNLNKTIIICFDGVFPHGGFVDRLKGIISFFEIAKQLKYDFKIRFDNPFELSYFFKPNIIQWEKNEIKYNLFDTKILYLMNAFSVNPIKEIQNTTANTILVYSNVDYLSTIFPKNTDQENGLLWKSNFNELFKYSDVLQKYLSKLPQENHIVFHSRFTSIMGDFKDTDTRILNKQEQQQLIDDLLEKIYVILKQHISIKAYVLSDSTVFLEYIKKNTDLKTLEGIPMHLDVKNNNASVESHIKTITDFIFMANSDSVYLLLQGKMHKSSFSKYAAILGNKPFQVI